MNPAIRLAPSGPPILNASGGPFAPGPGARLRLTETNFTMGGTTSIPTVADVIGPLGFGTAAAVLSLDTPQAGLEYRAKILLDVINTSTNTDGEVVLYLDVSIDGGTTFINEVANVHHIAAAQANVADARQMELCWLMTKGLDFGVVTGTTPTIKLRARANIPVGVLGQVKVDSLASSNGSIRVTGLAGTIHMELEECY